MPDLSLQLEQLRLRIARLENRGREAAPAWFEPRLAGAERNPAQGGEVVNEAGRHWQMERSWPAHSTHGVSDIGALAELPDDLLLSLGGEDRGSVAPGRWAFLDTETTGLAGGSGTVAFLVGVGFITPSGFELKQYFLREPSEEASMLDALEADLQACDVLVTYNGKSFDVPLLDTRYLMNRRKAPFSRLDHVDLLHGARRLWRLKLESCKLQDLERRILGHERVGDVGGAFIPNLYFDYLRNGNAEPLEPVFFHNAIDILSLACLTAIVPRAFREPELLKHGEELAGLARWFRQEERLEEAAKLMRLALTKPMRDELVWETLWHLGDIERKLERLDAAVAAWTELAAIGNPFQAQALERLGLHAERYDKNLAAALDFNRAAVAIESNEARRKRVERLEARLAKRPPGRLL